MPTGRYAVAGAIALAFVLAAVAARVVHALAVCLAFESLVLLSRHVLFPVLGGIAAVVVFALYFGGVLGVLMIRVGRLRAADPAEMF